MPLATSLRFSDLRRGTRARVARVDEECPYARRLQEMGFTVGTEFSVVKIAPFGDPVEINLRGYRVCLRRLECRCLEIESVG